MAEIPGSFVITTRSDHGQVAYMGTALRGPPLSESTDPHRLTADHDRIRSEALPAGMSRDLTAKAVEEQWT